MILAHPSLQRDKIEETMDAMASASADARDIDEAIKIGRDVAIADAGIDEGELEDELQSITREIEREKEAEAEGQRARLREEGMKVPERLPEAVDVQGPSKELPGQRHAAPA
jgi:charged multivesicular body protein 7